MRATLLFAALVVSLFAPSSARVVRGRDDARERWLAARQDAPLRKLGKALHLEPAPAPGALAAAPALRFSGSDLSGVADSKDVSTAEVREPVTFAVLMVLKLVTAVSAGFTQIVRRIASRPPPLPPPPPNIEPREHHSLQHDNFGRFTPHPH